MTYCFFLPPTQTLLVMVIIPLPISWEIYMVCMECCQGKKAVIMKGCFLGTPDCDWLHSW